MIVVSDTSAISNLLSIGRESILFEIFGQVIIPETVELELLRWHDALPAFLVVKKAMDRKMIADLADILDPGESEAIALTVELKADLLLIDERKGRSIAAELGLKTTGLLGVLLEAKTMGLMESVGPVLDELTANAGFRVSPAVRSEFLRLANE